MKPTDDPTLAATTARPSRRPPPEGLGVRRAVPGDAAAFAELMSDPRVYGTVLDLPHPSAVQWHAELSRLAPNDHYLCALRDGRLLGWGSLQVHAQARRRHSGVLGLAVAADWWGRGVGSWLIGELLSLADNWLDLRRVELCVRADNGRARALYESFGFEAEGLRRQWAYANGRYVDACDMARLVAPS